MLNGPATLPAEAGSGSVEPSDPAVLELAATLAGTVTWLRRRTRPAAWSAVALSTLDVLDGRGAHRVSELVALAHISQPGMTGLLGRLEAAGLVDREHDPGDRRAWLVRITEAGRNYLTEVRSTRAAVLAAQLSELSEEHLKALLAAAPALAALIDDAGRTPQSSTICH